MPRLLMVGRDSKALAELNSELVKNGFSCSITPYGDDAADIVSFQSPDVVLAEVDGYQPGHQTREFISEIKQRKALPVIALVTREVLDDLGDDQNIDDFISSPFDSGELVLRIKRLLKREETSESGETIRCEGLLIDLARCEVIIDGRKIELTFKEYELLKFLADNRGRVYTREALLDKIWGFDYYGGDRTVDVHIRRLRSKIEGPGQRFIETVRNIGYRFTND